MAKLKVGLDESQIRSLSVEERLTQLEEIAKTSSDESVRWDCVWLAGEIAEDVDLKGPLFERVGNLFTWMLINDDNGIVRHEVCYQIAGRNMRHKIPDLVESGLHDQSPLVRHEAIESLAIIRAFNVRDDVKKSLEDENPYVRETARFVLKRLDRLMGKEFDVRADYKAF